VVGVVARKVGEDWARVTGAANSAGIRRSCLVYAVQESLAVGLLRSSTGDELAAELDTDDGGP